MKGDKKKCHKTKNTLRHLESILSDLKRKFDETPDMEAKTTTIVKLSTTINKVILSIIEMLSDLENNLWERGEYEKSGEIGIIVNFIDEYSLSEEYKEFEEKLLEQDMVYFSEVSEWLDDILEKIRTASENLIILCVNH